MRVHTTHNIFGSRAQAAYHPKCHWQSLLHQFQSQRPPHAVIRKHNQPIKITAAHEWEFQICPECCWLEHIPPIRTLLISYKNSWFQIWTYVLSSCHGLPVVFICAVHFVVRPGHIGKPYPWLITVDRILYNHLKYQYGIVYIQVAQFFVN